MDYSIEIKKIEPIRVVYMKYKGIITKANKVFPSVFKSVGGKVNGAPLFIYHSVDQQTKLGDMELCVPTEKIPTGAGIEVKELPRIKALCTTHVGPYENLNFAYYEIEKYAKENQIQLCFPPREIFIKGPGLILKGNPQKYVTEIQFPVKEV